MIARSLIAGVVSALLLSSTAMAGDHWVFRIVNKSKLTADGFRTMEDGRWSDNWLHTDIEPDTDWNMDFGHSDGVCTVRTQVHFTDNTYFDYDVDYCKAKTLIIYNKTMKYE